MEFVGLTRMPKEAAAAEVKSLELRPGQTVRGTVLQHLPDGEALMSVGGMTLRAKLETNLAIGKPHLFLVMPGDGRSALLLKPLPSSANAAAAETLVSLLKSFGLQDTPLYRAALRALMEAGAPVTRDSLSAAVRAVTELNPPRTAQGEVFRAAAEAVLRGVPVTARTVSALHAALSGKGFAEALRGAEAAARSAVTSPLVSGAVREAAQQLLALLKRTDLVLSDIWGRAAKPFAPAGSPAMPGEAPRPAQPAPAAVSPQGVPPQGTSPSAAGAETNRLPPLFSYLKLLGIDAEREWLRLSLSPRHQAEAPKTGSGGEAQRGARPDLPPQPPQGQPAAQSEPGGQPVAARAAAGSAAAAPSGGLPSQGAKPAAGPAPQQAGTATAAEAARQAMSRTLPQSQTVASAPAPAAAGTAPAAAESAAAASSFGSASGAFGGSPSAGTALPPAPPPAPPLAEQPAALERPAETLKAVLMRLSAADDAPMVLRESAQQALQALTGQQLLMAQDRSLPMAYVTIMIPLKTPKEGPDGRAAVHIHTRRDSNGALDAENCRLWFQLSLPALGETWVDVTVADRMVSVQLWNDLKEAKALFQRQRETMEKALEEMGYRLLSFKHAEMPGACENARVREGAEPILTSSASPAPYRGVDLRI